MASLQPHSQRFKILAILGFFLLGSAGIITRTIQLIQFRGPDELPTENEKLRELAQQHPLLLGTPVDRKDWPSSVFVQPDLSLAKCSGSLIGPQVLLTAAHCLNSGDRVQINNISGSCEEPAGSQACDHTPHAPDIALCLMDQPVLRRKPFERTTSKSGWAKTGALVNLLGFGLATPLGKGLVLRQGGAQVKKPTDPTSGCVVVTGPGAACAGDSGGGAFLELGNQRMLVGVISSFLGCQAGLDTQIVT